MHVDDQELDKELRNGRGFNKALRTNCCKLLNKLVDATVRIFSHAPFCLLIVILIQLIKSNYHDLKLN